MKIKYIGMFASVEVGDTGIVVENGETVDLADHEELAGRLLEQPGNWQPANKAARDHVAELEAAAAAEEEADGDAAEAAEEPQPETGEDTSSATADDDEENDR